MLGYSEHKAPDIEGRLQIRDGRICLDSKGLMKRGFLSSEIGENLEALVRLRNDNPRALGSRRDKAL